ncbi:hypothetical protein BGZ46_009540, partial [Entomortierella lignicola]
FSGYFFSMLFIPYELNPYRTLAYVPINSARLNPEFRSNYHYGIQGSTNLHAFVRPEETRVLRNDFWGYFNQYNASATEYTLTSTLDFNSASGLTWIGLALPTVVVKNKQVLPLSPFGLIQKYLMRSSTKANISRVYGNWKKDEDGIYREEGGDRKGYRDSAMSFSSSFISGLDSAGLDKRASFQNFHVDPSSYEPFIEQGSDQNSQQQGFTGNNQAIPQYLVDELLILRKEMKAQSKVLKHLQRHEQRFMDIETLLKEFYLDMDLVDTKTVDSETIELMPPPLVNQFSSPDNRQTTSWIQKIFRSRNVNNDLEDDRMGLRAGAQEQSGYRQSQWGTPPHPPPPFSKAVGGYIGVPSDMIRLQQYPRED